MVRKIAKYIFLGFYGFKILYRSFIYSILFSSYGKRTIVAGKIKTIRPENISIGSCSTLNEGVFLNAQGNIKIGNYVHISPYVIINSAQLNLNNFSQKLHKKESVVIEDHVWICSGVIINPGVRIGKMSVVGAGAVVSKDVKPLTVVVGIPAKPTKKVKIKP